MNDRTITIIDDSRRTLATARIAEKEGYFAGSIDLKSMPAELRGRFEAYEEIVNGQMFSLLDEIEEEIGALNLFAVFDDGQEFPLEDLQIYPGSALVSFKARQSVLENPGRISDTATLGILPHLQDESRHPA
jgi:hypothetical protein